MVLGWCKAAWARLLGTGAVLPAAPTDLNQDMPARIHSPRAHAGALPANARLVIIGGRFEADNHAVHEAISGLCAGRIARSGWPAGTRPSQLTKLNNPSVRRSGPRIRNLVPINPRVIESRPSGPDQPFFPHPARRHAL